MNVIATPRESIMDVITTRGRGQYEHYRGN